VAEDFDTALDPIIFCNPGSSDANDVDEDLPIPVPTSSVTVHVAAPYAHFDVGLSLDRKVLRASYHQGDPLIFPRYYGTQCTSISTYALAMAMQLPVDQWNRETMNRILFAGDRLHGHCKETRNIDAHYLDTDDVSGAEINVQNVMVRLRFDHQRDDVIRAITGEVLLNQLAIQPYLLLIGGSKTVAVFQHQNR